MTDEMGDLFEQARKAVQARNSESLSQAQRKAALLEARGTQLKTEVYERLQLAAENFRSDATLELSLTSGDDGNPRVQLQVSDPPAGMLTKQKSSLVVFTFSGDGSPRIYEGATAKNSIPGMPSLDAKFSAEAVDCALRWAFESYLEPRRRGR